MVNQAHHHHHQGQNIPHQRRITHPQGPPLEPPQPYHHLFSGSKGLIGPPFPHLDHKDVPVVEPLLYDRWDQNISTAKDKEI